MSSDEGKQFYTNLITSLNASGISVIADLYHYDFPQRLVGKNGSEINEEYLVYVNTCFELFGEYVGHWITRATMLPEVGCFATILFFVAYG